MVFEIEADGVGSTDATEGQESGMSSPTELIPNITDDKALACCSCGGYPIDDGAAFVAIFYIKDGKRQLGGMCELCYLKRLQKRGMMVNMSSSATWQINLPDIGIHPMVHRKSPRDPWNPQ